MKTLQKLTAATFLLALFASPALAADPTASPAVVKYTCKMHPEVVVDAPGKCPKCGMKLVEKKTTQSTPTPIK